MKKLTDGNVLPSLVKFTVPILFSILLQTTYGTVDLLIVGQFSDIADVSGVTIGSQIMQTVTAFFAGLSMGTTILIAQYIGSNENKKSSKVVGVSIFLFTALAIIASFTIAACNKIIAQLMQTPAESFSHTSSYLFFTGIGTIFIVFYNLIGSVFRGIGDSKTPLVTVFIACVANIILDLIFVTVFAMGATGVALATVIAQTISVILSLVIIARKKLPFSFSFQDISFDTVYAKNIFKLGIPVAVQGMLVSVSFLVVTSIINVFGVIASAAVGIVAKITGVVMVVPQAFMQALSAFTAQNIGAGKPERAKKALFYSVLLSVAFGTLTAYLSAFHGTIFTRIFTDDAQTTGAALDYLKSYAIDCILVAFMFSFSGFFNGAGRTTFVMLHSVLSAFCIRIPLAYFFSTLENTSLFVIGLATPSSTAIQIIACFAYYMYLQKKNRLSTIA